MTKNVIVIGAVAWVALMLSSPLRAQNADSQTSDPAEESAVPYEPPPITQPSTNGTSAYAGFAIPDQRPLTGVQEMSLANSAETHNYLLPSINVTSQLNTSPGTPGYSGSTSATYLLGHLDVYHTTFRSELQLDYTGGEMFATNNGHYSSPVQDLEFAETFRGQRWTLLIADEANYLSQSPFGFGGVGGLGYLGGLSSLGIGGSLGGVTPFLNTSVVPNQTISTAWVPRVSNAAVSQVEYELTQRSSVTVSGSYGLLHFSDPGYLNSSESGVQIGYNYQLSPISSVALLYRFDKFSFAGLPEGFKDDVAQLAYARRLTDRLSFQIAVGPDLVIVRGEPGDSGIQYFWAADTSVNYQFSRMVLSASYDHLPTSGSGVLAGAYTDQFQGTLQRPIFGKWNASASVGFARNRELTTATQNGSPGAFHSWYTAFQASHALGSGTTFFVAYEATLQGTATEGCAVSGCGSNSISNQFSVGFNWYLRPTVLP